MARIYGVTITYRPVGPDLVSEPDTRPVDRCPKVSLPAQPSVEAREAKLLAECQLLEKQGYKIEAVERWNQCFTCQGVGEISLRPKGWRKRSAPPWYMLRKAPCPECGGQGAEMTTEV